jgi:polar amino acid transport system substrate-binding protein
MRKLQSMVSKSVFFLLISFFLFSIGCSTGSSKKKVVLVGIDPTWYPLELEGKESYVHGFIDELLEEISKQTSLQFVQINRSWDNLAQGLLLGDYQTIISAIPKIPETEKNFDFSERLLDTGPVLVLQKDAEIDSISEIQNGFIGCLQYTQEDMIIQTYLNVLPFYYTSTLGALTGLSNGQVDGVLIKGIPAVSYIEDLFPGDFEIVGKPFGNDGIRLITQKGKETKILVEFDRTFKEFKKTSKFKKLLQKWKMSAE